MTITAETSKFVRLPKVILKVGLTIKFDIFIHLPQNDSTILFRKKGDTLSADDVSKLEKVAPEHLLLPRDEINLLYESGADVFNKEIAKGNLDSAEVKATATNMLQTLNQDEDADVTKSLEGVAQMVANLIGQFKKTPSVLAYEETLKQTQGTDTFSVHHQQVSSISTLMAISIGKFSMEDLSDLAAAGLIHDMGLKTMSNSLTDAHLKGLTKFNNQEKIVYMRHVDLIVEHIKKTKLPVTPGALRIIELHHENWDGTGFKNLMGNRIYRPARVLRLADDLVSLINSDAKASFQSAMETLSKLDGAYDPEMIANFMAKS